MLTPKEIKRFYEEGENIMLLLRGQDGAFSEEEIVEIAYDMQAGSYTQAVVESKEIEQRYQASSACIAKHIEAFCQPQSIMEAGVGECTTLSGVKESLKSACPFYGFDISLSRILHGQKWLESQSLAEVSLCVGDLRAIPYRENSMDVVYTHHSIEPNRGKEKEMIQELYRVAARYLVLVEPAYELASDEHKARMDEYGYCKGLPQVVASLGYEVVESSLFASPLDAHNPSSVTIIKKGDEYVEPEDVYACPAYQTPLRREGTSFYSEEAMALYPVMAGVPCLRKENAILASSYDTLNLEEGAV